MTGGFSEKELAATYEIELLSTLLPGIIHSIWALSIGNASSTKYAHHFFAIKLYGDKLTEFSSKGHGLI